MKEFTEKLISRLEEKIKVTSLKIIATGTKDKPYFKIEYKEVGKEDYNTGYSSYELNNVFDWKDKCFEIVKKQAEEYLPVTNVGKKDGKTLTEQECFNEEGEEMLLIEDVLDTLIEVGNGVTDEALHESADKLFRVRDILNSKANDDGWIPCSERLPEKYGEYLCCDNYSNYIIGYPTKRVAYDEYYVETECEIMEDCIAWMPLPEPYKEKGE